MIERHTFVMLYKQIGLVQNSNERDQSVNVKRSLKSISG